MSSPRQSKPENPPQFEVFRKGSIPRTTQPMMTIQKGGAFSLNKAAYLILGEPKAVELLFDRVAQVIGLRRVAPTERHAFPVRPVGRGTTFALSGRSFCTHYGIPTDQARRFTARPVGLNVLAIDLNEVTGQDSEV